MTRWPWSGDSFWEKTLRVLLVIFLVVNVAAIVVDLTVGKLWMAPINGVTTVALVWSYLRWRRAHLAYLEAKRDMELRIELWAHRVQ